MWLKPLFNTYIFLYKLEFFNCCKLIKPSEQCTYSPSQVFVTQSNLYCLKTGFNAIKICMGSKHVSLPYNIYFQFHSLISFFFMKSVSISKFGPIAPFSIIYDQIRIIFVTFGLEPTQFQTPHHF